MTIENQYKDFKEIHVNEYVFKDPKIMVLKEILNQIEKNYPDLDIKNTKDFVWYNAGINYCISVINAYLLNFQIIEREKERKVELKHE
jgi:hypothetical protein